MYFCIIDSSSNASLSFRTSPVCMGFDLHAVLIIMYFYINLSPITGTTSNRKELFRVGGN